MWSPESQTIATWIGALSQLLIVFSLFIFWRQVLESRRQTTTGMAIHKSETLYETFRFIAEIRDDIEHIFDLENKGFLSWNDEDKRVAFTVCHRFTVVANLIAEDIIPFPPLARTFFYSLPKCNKILAPYILMMRQSRSQQYYRHFDKLAHDIVNFNISLAPDTYSTLPVEAGGGSPTPRPLL